ncbi:MAG: ribonuclease III [Patescibacteria group bacterium]|jgi:ribonuclease-3
MTPNQQPDTQELEKQIRYQFKDKKKLHQSLLHRSYLNENKQLKLKSNERYEFLGDAVLELWCSINLFRKFPLMPEGQMTNLRALVVRTPNLAQATQSIGLDRHVYLSKGEEKHGGRNNPSILADTFEALLGAIFLDGGLEAAFVFLDTFLIDSLNKLSQQKIYKDPKSIFQELAQSKKGVTPHYETIKEIGPDHQKVFEVAAYLGNEIIASGKGSSKQEAEEKASIKATKILKSLV